MLDAMIFTKMSPATRSDAQLRTGNPFFDMLFSMQKASQQALSVYTAPAERRLDGSAPQQSTSTVEVIPLGEEILNVGTRTMQGNTVRLRRVVVEAPVEKQVGQTSQAGMQMSQELVQQTARQQQRFATTAMQGWMEHNTRVMRIAIYMAEQGLGSFTNRSEAGADNRRGGQ